MDPTEFPANNASGKTPGEDKGLEAVTTGAVRRRRSLRKQFKDTFIGGDLKSSVGYVAMDVLLPAARDMVFEAISEGFRKLIFGDSSRRRTGGTTPFSGSQGVIQYNRYSSPGNRQNGPERTISRQARAKHNFDEIVIANRTEAEDVLEKLFEVVSKFDVATVADLYELVGLSSTHTDYRWGWTDLYGAGVSRIRGGYLLDLPQPEPVE